MIQKFICVPRSDYDVLIVTNGTIDQIESLVKKINIISNQEISPNSEITYLDDFKLLVKYVDQYQAGKSACAEAGFSGKVLFMFFNGLEYIQHFLLDIIDYYNRSLYTFGSYNYSQFESNHKSAKESSFAKLENAYFYFDSSITNIDFDFGLEQFMISDPMPDITFNTMMTIANDVLKKMKFMISRVRGVYIDDVNLVGGKSVALGCMLRNFPGVERVQLASGYY
jgi:hypothetical protein